MLQLAWPRKEPPLETGETVLVGERRGMVQKLFADPAYPVSVVFEDGTEHRPIWNSILRETPVTR